VPETWLINDINVAITTMGSEASNNNYRKPKFVAQVIPRPENDVRRAFSKLTAGRLFPGHTTCASEAPCRGSSGALPALTG
jgi:hypothetical protein